MDRTTNALSAAAVASPWWLPHLANVSQIAAFLLPILGVAWIVVQFIAFLRKK